MIEISLPIYRIELSDSNAIEIKVEKQNYRLIEIGRVVAVETLNASNYYNKSEIDGKMDGKIDNPDASAWAQFDIFLNQ